MNMNCFPSEPSFSHFRNKCIVCECDDKEMSKEHIFPQWLLNRTNTRKDKINWLGRKVPASSCTIPICVDCNAQLGIELEGPVSKIFESIENGNGFNDCEAELLVRWLWKINGMFYWSICNENWKYGYNTLKERVLSPIESPRNRISIVISLIEDDKEDFGCSPIGLDTFSIFSNVFCAGVFSKISIAVIYSKFAEHVNKDKWSVYTLSSAPLLMNPNYRIFPKVDFKTGSEAVYYTKFFFGNDSIIHKEHESIASLVRFSR